MIGYTISDHQSCTSTHRLIEQEAQSTSTPERLSNPFKTYSPAGRGNGSMRISSLQAMQRTHGNRAVQRYVQRQVPAEGVPVQRFFWPPNAKGPMVKTLKNPFENLLDDMIDGLRPRKPSQDDGTPNFMDDVLGWGKQIAGGAADFAGALLPGPIGPLWNMLRQ
jgi:hypothetical protein